MDAWERQYAVIGPPGCGKTTYVARQVERAVERYGEDSAIVCSLTKAAAREAAGRVTLGEDRVGTLHAFAFRAMGRPEIAEGKVKEWNLANPSLALTLEMSDDMDGAPEPGAGNGGDDAYQEIQRLRALRRPLETWPDRLMWFHKPWEDWKHANGYLDFTDLIEHALTETVSAPGSPRVIFFDEAQDASTLERELIRHWGRGCETVVTVGDPDQALYTWRGADPDGMFPANLPPERSRVLSQSYRVPEAVRARAVSWLARMPEYRQVEYLARRAADGATADGELRYSEARLSQPRALLGDLMEDLDAGQSVMVLSTCSYQLDPLIGELRREAVPFANPWRLRNGRWNPLAPRAGVSMGDRIAAFLRPSSRYWGRDARLWTAKEVRQWSAVLKADGIMSRGGKTRLEGLPDSLPPADLQLAMRESFTPEALAAIAAVDLQWWRLNLLPSKRGATEYPLAVCDRHGVRALSTPPKLYVGTVHSVKGGQADSVYLFPDLSVAGKREADSGLPSIASRAYRLFYVGMTRAREKLTLCAPSRGGLAVDW